MKPFLPALSAFLLVLRIPEVRGQGNGDMVDCPPDYNPVQVPLGSGDWKCQMVDTICPGVQRDYIDAETGQSRCCGTAKKLVILEKRSRRGICCEANQIAQGNNCVNPNHSDDNHHNGNGPTDNGSCSNGRGCPRQPSGACALRAACGNSTHIGLEYGHCYNLVFSDGHQLGRGRFGATNEYIQDGYVQNIPFKVCKSTTDCGTGSVQNDDNFFLQDLLGSPDDPNALPGWNNAPGGMHTSMTIDPSTAGKFKGKSACSANCKCIMRLSGNPGGLGFACPATQPGITFWQNRQVTLDLQFVEVPCDGDFSKAPFQAKGGNCASCCH
ncbi:hypothetical protein VKT23_018914 [Stygiomarasmius scandens]|uniref:Uncharacterized protein n=1 Tax=Marasmiellus scandens TaxID=2682957 RepID=A0ABR1IRA3_9AGAR